MGGREPFDGLDLVVHSPGAEPALGQLLEALLLGEDVGRREHPVDGRLGDRSAVAASGHVLRCRPRQIHQPSPDDLVGDGVDPPRQFIGRHRHVGRDGGSDLSDHLGSAPRRLLLGQRLHGLGRDPGPSLVVDVTEPALVAGGLGDKLRWRHAQFEESVVPVGPERDRIGVLLLVGTGVEDGLPLQAPPLSQGRLTVVDVLEQVDLLVDAAVDGLGPLGELSKHVGRDVGDLGDAVGWLVPSHAEAAGHLGAQARVVEPAQRLLVLLDGPGVEGEPAAVR